MIIHFGGLDFLEVVHLSILDLDSLKATNKRIGIRARHGGIMVGMHGETERDIVSNSWSNEKYQENASDMQILVFGRIWTRDTK